MLSILLLLALSCWCWFGHGPYFLRWPALLVAVLLTSGHPVGGPLGLFLEAIAPAILTLVIALAGLLIILRGAFGGWRSRRGSCQHRPPPWSWRRSSHYGRGDRYDHW